jgi:hypothetical protein
MEHFEIKIFNEARGNQHCLYWLIGAINNQILREFMAAP